MKKILLFSACVMLAFASCKKDSSKKISSNTITATIGGSNISFSTNVEAELATDSGAYILVLQGFNGSESNAQAIGIGIVSEAPIVKGTYSFNSSTDFAPTAIPFIEYTQNISGDDAFGTETDLNFDINGPNSSVYTTATVTITSVNSTNVQGTFSGLMINDSDNTNTETVTSGKFNVNLSANKNIQSFNKRISAAKLQRLKID